jgi:multidrug resistance efflux pump
VRLAQRVPVRIHIDQVPDGIRLVAGITATVQIDSEHGIAISGMRATPRSSPEHDLKNPGGGLSKSVK